MSESKSRADAFAQRFGTRILTLRWLIIVGSVLAVVGLTAGASRIQFDPSYAAFFSEENPQLQAFEQTRATYTKNDNFLFVLKPKDGQVFVPEVLEAVQWLTEQGWQIPYTLRVDSVTNFQHTYAEEDDLIVEDLVLDPAALGEAELAAKRDIALAEPLLNGQLLTDDAAVTAVNVTVQYPEESLEEVPLSVNFARDILREFDERFPDFETGITGLAMLNNAFNEAVETDNSTLVPLMFGVLIVFLLAALRSVSALIVTLLIVIFSSASAMGMAGYLGIYLTPVSTLAPVIILTLAVADSIHVLLSARVAMRDGLDKRAAILEAFRLNVVPVTITSLTTVVGFLSLNFADSPPFRDLGNITAMGITAAWAFSLLFLPAFLAVVPFKVKADAEGEVRSEPFVDFGDWVVAHYRLVLAGTILGSVGLISLIPQNEFNDTFTEYFDQRIEFRRHTDFGTQYFGLFPIDFSVEAGSAGGISEPDFLQVLEDFSAWARVQPGVKHVYSLSDIMKRLNKNLHADDESYYRVPDDRELSAQYLLLYELSLPYGLDLNDRVNIDKSATRLTVTLTDVSTLETKAFLRNSAQWFADNAPQLAPPPQTGVQVMFTFIADRNVESMIRGTTIAIFAIGLIMFLTLRSVSIGLLSIVANGLPILVTFGAWAVLVGQVGFAVAMVTSISLGIIVDNTVHFLSKYIKAAREDGSSAADAIRYAFRNVGFAVFVNTLVLTVGFLVFTFSAFDINVQLGLLTALAIAIAFVLDFLLLPAILVAVSRRTASA